MRLELCHSSRTNGKRMIDAATIMPSHVALRSMDYFSVPVEGRLLIRSLVWLIEKLLQLVFVGGGIFSFAFFMRLQPALKRRYDYLQMRVLKNEITQSEASIEIAQQILAAMAYGVPIVGGCGLAGLAAHRLGQFRRDHSAKRLIETVRARAVTTKGRMPKYVLYLRTFSSTNKYVRNKPTDLSRGLIPALPSEHTELEREIQKSLSGEGKLVALGKPGEHVGGGRMLSTETTWQDDVVLLLKFANWIVCVPSSEAGILWETQLLFDDQLLLPKTLFLMPPSENYLWKKNHRLLSLVHTPAIPETSSSKSWENMRACLLASNIMMPPYRETGCLFYMTSKSTVTLIEDLGSRFDANWNAVLKEAKSLRATLA